MRELIATAAVDPHRTFGYRMAPIAIGSYLAFHSHLPPDVPENRLPVQHASQVGSECGCRVVSAEGVIRHVDECLRLDRGGDLSLCGDIWRFEPLIT